MAIKQEHIGCYDCDFFVYLAEGHTMVYQEDECFKVLHPDDSLHFALGLNNEGTLVCPCCRGDLYYDDEIEE